MQTSYKIRSEPDPVDRSITLLLDGKFSEEAIAELDQSISAARNTHQRVYIDLSEVTLVDRKTVEFFSEQAIQDVKLINCPVYLQQWIGQVDNETT